MLCIKKNKFCLKSNTNFMQFLHLWVGNVAGCRVHYEWFCAGRVGMKCSFPLYNCIGLCSNKFPILYGWEWTSFCKNRRKRTNSFERRLIFWTDKKLNNVNISSFVSESAIFVKNSQLTDKRQESVFLSFCIFLSFLQRI